MPFNYALQSNEGIEKAIGIRDKETYKVIDKFNLQQRDVATEGLSAPIECSEYLRHRRERHLVQYFK